MTYEFFLTIFPAWPVARPWIQWVQRLSMCVHIHTYVYVSTQFSIKQIFVYTIYA